MPNPKIYQFASFAVHARKHPRSKYLRLSIAADNKITFSVPRWVSWREAERFLHEKLPWLESQLGKLQDKKIALPGGPSSPADFKLRKKEALSYVTKRTHELNVEFYHFPYHRVSVKNLRSQWGSCSVRRNLNFHYRILDLPSELADYLIVHELCHLQEMNHSKDYWQLVAKAVPDYKTKRKQLKQYSL